MCILAIRRNGRETCSFNMKRPLFLEFNRCENLFSFFKKSKWRDKAPIYSSSENKTKQGEK